MLFHQGSLLPLSPPWLPTIHSPLAAQRILQKLSRIVPPLLKSSKGSHLTQNKMQSPHDGPQALHNLSTRLPTPTVTSLTSPLIHSPDPVTLASLIPETRSCLGAFALAVPCA